jgi:hypothetical protein
MDFDKIEAIETEFKNILRSCVYEDSNIEYWDVEFTVFGPTARVNRRKNKLKIDEQSWSRHNHERRLTTLLHEAAHVEDNRTHREGSHKLSFWNAFTQIYHCASSNPALLEFRYDWEEVAKNIVKNAHEQQVDRRQTTIGELRRKLESDLGVTVDDHYSRDKYQAKFDDITITGRLGYQPFVDVNQVDSIKPDKRHSTETLWNKFKELRTNAKKGIFKIPLPRVANPRPESNYPPNREGIELEPCTEEDLMLLEITELKDTSIGVFWDVC